MTHILTSGEICQIAFSMNAREPALLANLIARQYKFRIERNNHYDETRTKHANRAEWGQYSAARHV